MTKKIRIAFHRSSIVSGQAMGEGKVDRRIGPAKAFMAPDKYAAHLVEDGFAYRSKPDGTPVNDKEAKSAKGPVTASKQPENLSLDPDSAKNEDGEDGGANPDPDAD